MAHHITWHTHDRILYIKAWGNVSALEITMIGVKLWNMCDKGNAPVYIILDATQIQVLNAVIPVIVDSSRYTKHPHFGAQFLLRPIAEVRDYIEDIQSVSYYPMIFVNQLEDALAHIHQLEQPTSSV